MWDKCKGFVLPFILACIASLIGAIYWNLQAADQRNENRIKETRTEVKGELKTKVDNKTLQLMIEAIHKDNQMIQKTMQMQIDNQQKTINEMKQKKTGGN